MSYSRLLFSGWLFFIVWLQSVALPQHPKPPKIPLFDGFIDNFHSVERGKLYRCKQLSPSKLLYYLTKLGIKTVINLRGHQKDASDWLIEKSIVLNNDALYYSIPMQAKYLPSKNQILKLLHLYRTAPQPILVHCMGGADRSGQAAALWVLEQQKLSKKKALRHLSLRYRHIENLYPAKRFFIKLWQGTDWLVKKYNPLRYPHYLPSSKVCTKMLNS